MRASKNLMTDKFAPSESHNEIEDNVGPDLIGVSGDGGLGRARTLVRRERPQFYNRREIYNRNETTQNVY